MLRSHDIETEMNARGYSHGRHADQAQRVSDFRKIVRGANFMTPRTAGMYRLRAKPYVIVEISLGEFMSRDMIGITVVDCAKGENCFDLSTCVNTLDELMLEIAKLEKAFASGRQEGN